MCAQKLFCLVICVIPFRQVWGQHAAQVLRLLSVQPGTERWLPAIYNTSEQIETARSNGEDKIAAYCTAWNGTALMRVYRTPQCSRKARRFTA